MTAKDLLLDQTASSHRWIEKLIDHVPAEKWGLIPAGLNTSLKWQVGHLVLSQHYHAVVVIAGPQPDLLEKVPVKAYSPYFVFGDKLGEVDERFTVEALRASLRLVQEKGLWAIGQLADGDLAGPLPGRCRTRWRPTSRRPSPGTSSTTCGTAARSAWWPAPWAIRSISN